MFWYQNLIILICTYSEPIKRSHSPQEDDIPVPKLPKKGREAQYHPHVGQKRHERFYDDQTCHKKPTVDFVSPPTTDHDTQSNKK